MNLNCCHNTHNFVGAFHYLKTFDCACNTLFKTTSHFGINKDIFNTFAQGIEYTIADTALTIAIVLKNWSHSCNICKYCMKVFQKAFFEFALDVLSRRQ